MNIGVSFEWQVQTVSRREVSWTAPEVPAEAVAAALAQADAERGAEDSVTAIDGAERFRPGLHLKGANAAELIYFGTSGYGNSGPDREFVTWGPNIEALAGMSTLSGFPERDCTTTQYAYPDGLSALHGLVAVISSA